MLKGDIVENNNNLLEYKKQVMDMFDLIISNKEYLNELRLLNKLKELNITYVDGDKSDKLPVDIKILGNHIEVFSGMKE